MLSSWNADDLVDLAATQRGEDDGLIDTVEELWTDRLLQKAEYQLTRLIDSSLLTARGDVGETLTDEVGAEVARHDDDRILEVHQTTLIIRQTTVIEDLQEDVEDVGGEPSRSHRRGRRSRGLRRIASVS